MGASGKGSSGSSTFSFSGGGGQASPNKPPTGSSSDRSAGPNAGRPNSLVSPSGVNNTNQLKAIALNAAKYGAAGGALLGAPGAVAGAAYGAYDENKRQQGEQTGPTYGVPNISGPSKQSRGGFPVSSQQPKMPNMPSMPSLFSTGGNSGTLGGSLVTEDDEDYSGRT